MATSSSSVGCVAHISSSAPSTSSPSTAESDSLQNLFVECVRSYIARAGSDVNWPLIARSTALMLLYLRRRHPSREWVRFLLRSRETFCEYHHLVRDMRLDDGQDFYRYFRMTRQRFDHLLSLVGPHLQKKTTFWRKPISPEERLALTIRYLAHGSSQLITSMCYRLGRSTASSIIRETCQALHKVLDPLYRPVSSSFLLIYGKKKSFMRDKIFYCMRSMGDIFALSIPLCEWRVIENSFGILVARWRIFKQPIQASPETLEAIVWACVSVHNYLRVCDETENPERRYCPANYVDRETEVGEVVTGRWRADAADGSALSDVSRIGSNMHAASAKQIRDKLTRYFCSRHGEVPWQYKVIFRGAAPAEPSDR
ncbi:hypothetical protein HPB47_017465 [Ixodes persulcatus]|uniref:Uncharacterized protein n=1 Tax=Ixodes persulcatus TaxID=34615 RepID=A0AC60QQ86_IXOPE|nr:hypothetical protein HPB47_017465 [Ixodes persulcatus]